MKALPANRPLKCTLGAGPHEIGPSLRSLVVALFPLNLEKPHLALSFGRRGPVAHCLARVSVICWGRMLQRWRLVGRLAVSFYFFAPLVT